MKKNENGIQNELLPEAIETAQVPKYIQANQKKAILMQIRSHLKFTEQLLDFHMNSLRQLQAQEQQVEYELRQLNFAEKEV